MKQARVPTEKDMKLGLAQVACLHSSSAFNGIPKLSFQLVRER